MGEAVASTHDQMPAPPRPYPFQTPGQHWRQVAAVSAGAAVAGAAVGPALFAGGPVGTRFAGAMSLAVGALVREVAKAEDEAVRRGAARAQAAGLAVAAGACSYDAAALGFSTFPGVYLGAVGAGLAASAVANVVFLLCEARAGIPVFSAKYEREPCAWRLGPAEAAAIQLQAMLLVGASVLALAVAMGWGDAIAARLPPFVGRSALG